MGPGKNTLGCNDIYRFIPSPPMGDNHRKYVYTLATLNNLLRFDLCKDILIIF